MVLAYIFMLTYFSVITYLHASRRCHRNSPNFSEFGELQNWEYFNLGRIDVPNRETPEGRRRRRDEALAREIQEQQQAGNEETVAVTRPEEQAAEGSRNEESQPVPASEEIEVAFKVDI